MYKDYFKEAITEYLTTETRRIVRQVIVKPIADAVMKELVSVIGDKCNRCYAEKNDLKPVIVGYCVKNHAVVVTRNVCKACRKSYMFPRWRDSLRWELRLQRREPGSIRIN